MDIKIHRAVSVKITTNEEEARLLSFALAKIIENFHVPQELRNQAQAMRDKLEAKLNEDV